VGPHNNTRRAKLSQSTPCEWPGDASLTPENRPRAPEDQDMGEGAGRPHGQPPGRAAAGQLLPRALLARVKGLEALPTRAARHATPKTD